MIASTTAQTGGTQCMNTNCQNICGRVNMTRGASTVYFKACTLLSWTFGIAAAHLFRMIRFYCWRRLAAAIKIKETFSLNELVSLMLLMEF